MVRLTAIGIDDEAAAQCFPHGLLNLRAVPLLSSPKLVPDGSENVKELANPAGVRGAAHLVIEGGECLQEPSYREFGSEALLRSSSVAHPQFGVTDQSSHGGRQRPWIVHRDEDAVDIIDDGLANSTNVAADSWQPGGGRFKQHDSKCF